MSPTLYSHEPINEKYVEDSDDVMSIEKNSQKVSQDFYIKENGSKEQVINLKDETNKNKELNGESRSSSSATAFELMKAAFSNLNGPSLVSNFFIINFGLLK